MVASPKKSRKTMIKRTIAAIVSVAGLTGGLGTSSEPLASPDAQTSPVAAPPFERGTSAKGRLTVEFAPDSLERMESVVRQTEVAA